MYLLFADETNVAANDHVVFFVYGGLAIPSSSAKLLSDEIGIIRVECGYSPTDHLKFGTNTRPALVSRQQWTASKHRVIEACARHEARFMAVVVSHQIAVHRRDRLIDWQLGHLLKAFDQSLLASKNDDGLVIMDRIDNAREYGHLRDRFMFGTGSSASPRPYARIIGCAATCDGASHLASAADIVLGTFAFCVNQRAEPQQPLVKRLYGNISRLMWTPSSRGSEVPWGVGVIPVPMPVHSTVIKRDYDDLRRHLQRLT